MRMILISGKIFLIYIRKTIGEIGEPCDIPILILIFSYLFLLNVSCKCLLFMKHSIQLYKNLDRSKL